MGKNYRFGFKVVLSFLVVLLLSGNVLAVTYANNEDPPEEYRRGSALDQVGVRATEDREASFGIAWADPNGTHSQYEWPFTVEQMGHVIQSYQNYSSGTSQAYFHHGIDMIAPNGTQVFTRSGGQVVNIENYRPGNSLYWEVAILDDEGYVWQYHHIDRNTIPQAIFNKFNEWKANPATGGYVPPNTHIGNIVYWTVTSFGYRFNHIHLNIIADGDVYIDPLEFHVPLEDNQPPEIQEIGLLNGNTIVSGNTVSSGNYGLYVRARDLFKSNVYYLPPYKTEFSVDGGVWTTVWEFHDLPGGSSDSKFLHDFFVPNYTKGNYTARDFYINLGFIPGSQYQFPTAPGTHTIDVRVWDYNGNSTTDSFTWIIEGIPDDPDDPDDCVQIPVQADTFLQQTNTNYNWGGNNLIYARRNITTNERALHPLLKWDLSSIPQDAQVTSAEIALRVTQSTTSIFNLFYLKQGWIEGRLSGAVSNSSANWSTYNGINAWGAAGAQSTTLDRSHNNLWNATSTSYNATGVRTITLNSAGVGVVQSWVDKSLENYGMTIQPMTGSGTLTFASKEHTQYQSPTLKVCFNYGEPTNHPPIALSQSIHTGMNVPVSLILNGTDEDGDPLSFRITSGPSHGQLTGDLNQSRSTISYAPDYGYRGEDSFSFVANDGSVDSEPATVSIWVYDPTSADLVSFEGAYQNGENKINWVTSDPYSFGGCDLYRADFVDGMRTKLNDGLILSTLSTAMNFEHFDRNITMGHLYFYWLECLRLSDFEMEEFGPIEVRSGFQGFIPMIVN